jgi:hypothetical protein
MYKENPKMQGSGLLDCISQRGECPVKCSDCFFASGRGYLEPLSENLPNIPDIENTKNKIIRMNAGGNDSNNQRELVETIAQQFDNYFFNTSIPYKLSKFSGPVVLTLNPAKMTDNNFHKLDPIPNNLMFVRIRTNIWNLDSVVYPAIEYYTKKEVTCVLTFMAYYDSPIPEEYQDFYEWKQRTINSYYCIKQEEIDKILLKFRKNIYVSCCAERGYSCKFCGHCLRTYFATKERIQTA